MAVDAAAMPDGFLPSFTYQGPNLMDSLTMPCFSASRHTQRPRSSPFQMLFRASLHSPAPLPSLHRCRLPVLQIVKAAALAHAGEFDFGLGRDVVADDGLIPLSPRACHRSPERRIPFRHGSNTPIPCHYAGRGVHCPHRRRRLVRALAAFRAWFLARQGVFGGVRLVSGRAMRVYPDRSHERVMPRRHSAHVAHLSPGTRAGISAALPRFKCRPALPRLWSSDSAAPPAYWALS